MLKNFFALPVVVYQTLSLMLGGGGGVGEERRGTFCLPSRNQYIGVFKVDVEKTLERGCCVISPLVTKLFLVVLLHKDVTQRDLKKSRPYVIYNTPLLLIS